MFSFFQLPQTPDLSSQSPKHLIIGCGANLSCSAHRTPDFLTIDINPDAGADITCDASDLIALDAHLAHRPKFNTIVYEYNLGGEDCVHFNPMVLQHWCYRR